MYDRHVAAIHRFVARRLGDHAADDVVAETFLAAFRKRSGYRLDRHDAGPWLYGIAIRLIGKHRREEVRMWRAIARSGVDPWGDGGLEDIEDRLATVDVQRAVADALGGLAGRDRDVLLLIAWAELSYDEVATALGIPVGTVRSRLHRARGHLRAQLTQPQAITPIEELCHERA